MKKLVTILLSTGMIFAQAKPNAPAAKPVAPAQPAVAAQPAAPVAAPIAAPATTASKNADVMAFTVSAFGGLALATPRSTYSTEVEALIKKYGGTSEVTQGSPTGGAAAWYGNNRWQAGLGGSYIQTYKNVGTISPFTLNSKLSYITAQANFRYFVWQGLYACVGLGVGIGTLTVDSLISTHALKSNIAPAFSARIGYDYEIPDLGVTVGGYADATYLIATITSGTTEYNASNLVVTPGIMVSYKF